MAGSSVLFRRDVREHVALVRFLAKWLLVGIPVGAVIGSAVAAFLWLLGWATQCRLAHPWLLYLLPVGGIAVGLLYARFGESVEAGNNLIMDRIHAPGAGVPARMAPLVLICTVLTHLFGGSAGREGTAVQMGGSIASTVGRAMKLNQADTRILLMTGVAAGFGAVFGTPFTGALFALEVLSIGVIRHPAAVPCLIASLSGDWATRALGIEHTPYHITGTVTGGPALDCLLLAKVALAAVAFGLASVLFASLTHGLRRVFKQVIPVPYLRPAFGGLIVIALAWSIGPDYLGLGVTNPPGRVSIVTAFGPSGATAFSWWWKILFTAVTLGSGFKGGEVTPLFFIGATLGNATARLLHAPVDLFAGLGFVAVFAAATNTPIACTIMGVELFGTGSSTSVVAYLAVACFVSYLTSGRSGIYSAQKTAHAKLSAADEYFL